MPALSLEKATAADAAKLAQISKRAFDSDIDCDAPGPGGPPGYDSPAWQARTMRAAAAYYTLRIDGEIAGGAIVFDQGRGRYYLARIFLDPAYHRQGIGLSFMDLVLAQFPQAGKWSLETPAWNWRTRRFYLKAGFQLVRQIRDELFFEKEMGVQPDSDPEQL